MLLCSGSHKLFCALQHIFENNVVSSKEQGTYTLQSVCEGEAVGISWLKCSLCFFLHIFVIHTILHGRKVFMS